jgi:hypothetical protein
MIPELRDVLELVLVICAALLWGKWSMRKR